MLNRVITNIYDNALRPLDLKVSQMNILVAAAKMGTARPIEVCEYLLSTFRPSAATSNENEGSWLAGSCARRRWPRAALSPDTTWTEAPGKGGSGWSEAQQQVKEGSWGRVRGALTQAMKRVSKGGAAANIAASHTGPGKAVI